MLLIVHCRWQAETFALEIVLHLVSLAGRVPAMVFFDLCGGLVCVSMHHGTTGMLRLVRSHLSIISLLLLHASQEILRSLEQ